jgi:hypothetical protein
MIHVLTALRPSLGPGERRLFVKRACTWQANALIRWPAMLSTAVNPTDGLRFDGDADSFADGDVHP